MAGYTKVFGSLLTSTIWRESQATRLVWITMLLMKNREQVVDSSVPGLADMAKVSLEECLAALEVLKAPDKWSRTKEHEGRRIVEVPGGWKILNGAAYRDSLTAEDVKEANRIYKRNQRLRESATPSKPMKDELNYLAAKKRGDDPEANRILERNLTKTMDVEDGQSCPGDAETDANRPPWEE